jgi:hypothetical protein
VKGLRLQKKIVPQVIGFLLIGLAIFTFLQPVYADISPQYLKNGRTYDQEREYIQWSGSVAYVNLYHRDNTSLPASEGGASCSNGCTENVTRIYNGGSVSGNFTFLKTFSVQLASSGSGSVGTAVIRACGQVVYTSNMYLPGAGAPGFNNFPNPAWNVPISGDCTWSITATGGYVDFRAVTTTFRSSAAPTVDLKVNGSDGPLTISPPGNYTLSWSSSNAAACSASGAWSGSQVTNGTQAYSNISSGSYTYTLTCTNPAGSASDSITIDVMAPLSGTIAATYARLPLYAPTLGLPAQTLTGTVSGGNPPYIVLVQIREPSGNVSTLSRNAASWSVTPENSGDDNLGTTQEGTWIAWAEIEDSAGVKFRTASASWEVAWYPVHGLP